LERSIAWVTPFESLGAWLFVALVLAFLAPLVLNIPNTTFYQTYFPMALIIGAIACATAPAATVAVLKEFKAEGPLTTTLLAVVALDDAVAVIAFAIALCVSRPFVTGDGAISFYEMLGVPLLHIVEGIAIGVALGFALTYIVKLVKTRELLLVVVFGMIMLCSGVANHLGVSLILANMAAGFIVVNKARENEMFHVVGGIAEVVFVMFFVLAGLYFDMDVMKTAGILALMIVAGRFLGKYFGSRGACSTATGRSCYRFGSSGKVCLS